MPRDYDECPICLGPHEDDIHAATLNIRHWLRMELNYRFYLREQLEEALKNMSTVWNEPTMYALAAPQPTTDTMSIPADCLG